ncbi:hypothetical protein LSCM1_06236 [Leishmania martiniquensis]|uniref:Nuclear cap binding complex subunit CBP30 n=1 Tax=Leishmania martiniquensis TaxID=1580590 RepID=A0A836KWE2_9TRYP|nr:hypothetical protein LSCM1_06236 [Leishmania martiniquensis]
MPSPLGQHGRGDAHRGSGFVHLNTPATIQYTAGKTLTLASLRERKSRVECAVLPESLSVWRNAFQRYVKEEGYSNFAADMEDERSGSGPILPPLVQQRAGPVRRRARETALAEDAFFCTSAPLVSPCTSSTAAQTGADGLPLSCGTASTTSTTACESSSSARKTSSIHAEYGGDVTDGVASSATEEQAGIAIVSHHKILGRQKFVYPDHDGVLSAGVVPQIVVTAEEKAEEAAARAFYISPLAMSEEELTAFEELQALWKSRARSHSFLGAQHRRAAQGAVDPSSSTNVVDAIGAGQPKVPRREGVRGGACLASGRGSEVDTPDHAETEATVEEEKALEKELAEALRMADDLLRFA